MSSTQICIFNHQKASTAALDPGHDSMYTAIVDQKSSAMTIEVSVNHLIGIPISSTYKAKAKGSCAPAHLQVL